MDWSDIQWPAMVVTLLASWMVGSSRERLRNWAFWVFLASNALWLGWGVTSNAWALIVLQVGLAITNIRGTLKTRAEKSSKDLLS